MTIQNFLEHIEPLKKSLRKKSILLTNNPFLADDLFQESMYRAMKSISSFKPNSNLKAWLYRIMINTYISEIRKSFNLNTRYNYEDVESIQYSDHVQIPLSRFHHIDEDYIVDNLGLDDTIANAFHDLRKDYREAILYADIHGYSHKEISEKFDIPIGTVMSRIHRGRKELRQKLECNHII